MPAVERRRLDLAASVTSMRRCAQVGINNAAMPAPPSIPTADTNMAITVLVSRLYL
jgi:hypothetical protein